MNENLSEYFASYSFQYTCDDWDDGQWELDGGVMYVMASSPEEAQQKVIDAVVKDYEEFEVDRDSFTFEVLRKTS